MKKISARSALLAGWLVAASMTALAQDVAPSLPQVTVTFGQAKAIKYKYMGQTARIGFQGTVLLPQAQGGAKVRSHEEGATIRAVFEHLEPASRFGPEYMTYVLWAVSPVGRATNLGEVVVKANGKAQIKATTNLQTFGLVVSAEPHFAVTHVSDLVVLENVLTADSKGKVEEVEARYPLLPRGTYVLNSNPATLVAPKLDRKVSPYVYQARNAVRIARAEQADQFAPEEFMKAEASFQQMETEKKLWKKPAIILARQTIQLAEDARTIGVKHREETHLAEERRAAEEARAQAEAARIQAEAARLQESQEALRAKERAVHQASKEATQNAKQEVRRKLAKQLGALLRTQDTERGLIVRMSNVLFSTGKAELRPQVREKIAKVAGILMAYPGLTVKVEGHTDNTGQLAFNQELSERRASQVRDFLLSQGLSPQSITAAGLADTQPLASNDTPSGRQQNRRVELIVAGEPIGL